MSLSGSEGTVPPSFEREPEPHAAVTRSIAVIRSRPMIFFAVFISICFVRLML
ncbi:MAG: hypothetical protein IKT01_00665 [Eubacteriaceae bacterium]|nr:hypothetical protein [Eubacteriaceae bacterium]